MDFPKISDITDKNIQYKFVMKIQTPDILKSLGFCVNLLFKNRESRKKKRKNHSNNISISFTAMNNVPFSP